MANTYLENCGLELIQHPITRVRVVRVDGTWRVQYQRKPKWWIDGYFWYTEGVYSGSNYSTAFDHSQQLINNGYYTRLEYKKKEVFEVQDIERQ